MLAPFQRVPALPALVMYTWNMHIDEIFDSTGIDNKENSDSMLDRHVFGGKQIKGQGLVASRKNKQYTSRV